MYPNNTSVLDILVDLLCVVEIGDGRDVVVVVWDG